MAWCFSTSASVAAVLSRHPEFSAVYGLIGLMQKRRNFSALAMESRLFCIKPSIHHTCPMRPGSLIMSTHISSISWLGLIKIMFVPLVVKDHLSWETIWFNGCFIQASINLLRIHKKHPISQPHRWVTVHPLWVFWKTMTSVIMGPNCINNDFSS